MSPAALPPVRKLPVEQIERLVQRILGGEVAFFIGAGFSLDSEGNTGSRLVARLLARFAALNQHLCNCQGAGGTVAAGLCTALQRTFNLERDPSLPAPMRYLTKANVEKLAAHYYLVNDWFCSAFGTLLDHLATTPGVRQAIDLGAVNAAENANLTKLQQGLGAAPAWPPMAPCNLEVLLALPPGLAGKALFLDTMGFDDPGIMAGAPYAEGLEAVAQSYAGRLRPRHQVLARLAREGFSPLTITTNYDLLLEGAYRLAGLEPRAAGPAGADALEQDAPADTYGHFDRIAGASHYFAGGTGYRTALIVKMHGCVDSYRRARATACRRQGADVGALAAYLPAIVFTFREIQGWREDSWSRDLLRSVLRTRTVVFCGYSAQDPVIHDTVRSVYEEMTERRRRESPAATGAPTDRARPAVKAEQAPAFLFDVCDRGNFHGTEILRAAAQAVGVESPSLTDCPNLLEFVLQDAAGEAFPTIDDLLRWLLHRTLRERQRQALRSHLAAVVTALIGHPVHEDDLELVRERFAAVLQAETAPARQWRADPQSRRGFERVCGWTEGFHYALLRQIAAADVLRRSRGPGAALPRALRERLRSPWYCPTLDHLDWTAWAVVVELALRQLAACWRGAPASWMEAGEWLRPGAMGAALIDFAGGPDEPTPLRLTIGIDTGARPGADSPLRKRIHWQLGPDTIPWIRHGRPQLPSARALWDLAAGDPASEADGAQTALEPLMRNPK